MSVAPRRTPIAIRRAPGPRNRAGPAPLANGDLLRDPIDGSKRPLALRVDQYHAMIQGGILSEGAPYELLDGYIVPKDRSAAGEHPMTVGLDHAWAIRRLASLGPKFLRYGCCLQTQLPVTLPPYNEPEPDGAILSGSEDNYRKRHPGAKDVACVIEVGDSSLQHDRTFKGRIYANSGVPTYVIINLIDRAVEVYTQPLSGQGRYGHSVTLFPRQSVVFPAAGGRELKVPVRRLLP